MYTSLELSKKLAEVGFDEANYSCCFYINTDEGWDSFIPTDSVEDAKKLGYHVLNGTCIRAYDILNDLCVKYAKEVFDGAGLREYSMLSEYAGSYYELHAWNVMSLMQDGKQGEAEKYIEENSILFNKEK